MAWDFTGVNWVAVVVAAVVGLIIGFAWFAPQLFGKQWAREAGVQLGSASTTPPTTYVWAVVSVLLTAYVLAFLAHALGLKSVVDGAILGAIVWLGFVGPWTLASVTFEKKSWMYFYLTGGQGLVSLLVMGAILGAMG